MFVLLNKSMDVLRKHQDVIEDLKEYSDKLDSILNYMQDSRPSVVFAGEFKSGKSTILNNLILKEDILYTDYSEATAVPTYISKNDVKKLIVYKYKKPLNVIQQNISYDVSFVKNETDQLVFDNPDSALIKKYTAGDEDSERYMLANTILRCELQWPIDNISNEIKIVDLPGINSCNMAVWAASQRVISQASLIVFVKTNQIDLNQAEKDFLLKNIPSKQKNKLLLVYNYNPALIKRNKQNRQEVIESLKQQLANIGLDGVQVALVCVKSNSTKQGSSIDELFSDKKQSEESDEFKEEHDNFYNIFYRFISNARAEWEAFFIDYTKKILENAVKNLENKKAILELAPSTKDELENALQIYQKNSFNDLSSRFDTIEKQLKSEANKFNINASNAIDAAINDIFQQISEKTDIAELQNVINQLDTILPRTILYYLQKPIDDFQQKTQTIVDSRLILSDIDLDMSQYKNSSTILNILTKIPQSVLTIADYVLTASILPSGMFIDILIRYFGGKISFIKGLFPMELVKTFAVKQVKNSLIEAINPVKQHIFQQVDFYIQSVMKDMEQNYISSQQMKAQEALKVSREQKTDEKQSIAAINNAIKDIQSIM